MSPKRQLSLPALPCPTGPASETLRSNAKDETKRVSGESYRSNPLIKASESAAHCCLCIAISQRRLSTRSQLLIKLELRTHDESATAGATINNDEMMRYFDTLQLSTENMLEMQSRRATRGWGVVQSNSSYITLTPQITCDQIVFP